jgi:hypothetical protein
MVFAGNPPEPAGIIIRDAPLSFHVLKSRFQPLLWVFRLRADIRAMVEFTQLIKTK